MRALPFVLPLALLGCASRSVDVVALPTSPAEFQTWDCARMDDELDRVQRQAAEVAYSVDERAGNNIIALGLGVTVFWPALLAMRTEGPEAGDLARLKGRFEALRAASQRQACPPPSEGLSAAAAAALPVAQGERLIYEDRSPVRGPGHGGAGIEWVLQLSNLRRGELEWRAPAVRPPLVANAAAQAVAGAAASLRAASSSSEPGADPYAPSAPRVWLQDGVGNIIAAPDGALQWPRLLRGDLVLGSVTAGDITVSGDPDLRARMRGQVVAVGVQSVAGRRFDAAVVELFGDAQRGDVSTRVEGVIVIDRKSGVLLRLDLRSAQPAFSLLRRLVRVEAAPG